jgi:hypothetical protein
MPGMKNTKTAPANQKGGMLLWLIVLVVILGGAVYIKQLKQRIAELEKMQPAAAGATTPASSLTTH